MNKWEEQSKTEAQISKCPECRHGEKGVEAHLLRREHYLSFGRVHGVAKLRQHLIEQHGEERYAFSYAHVPGMIDRKLMVEAWKMDLKAENLKSMEGL